MVISVADNFIETVIAAAEWTISARQDETVFTYAYVYQTMARMSGNPLRGVVDLSILPPELTVGKVEVIAGGQGVFICQGFARPLDNPSKRPFSA